jgi:hypothetical protein
MSTRRALSPISNRQERFASSAEFERGLMAGLVARRCDVLDRTEDRDLVYFLQMLSHREGGLKQVAADLLAMFPQNIGTRSMHRFGIKPGGSYKAEQVKEIREELGGLHKCDFLLYGEIATEFDASELLDESERRDALLASTKRYPQSYPVDRFIEVCRSATAQLESDLGELCLNPEFALAEPYCGRMFSPWYFQNAISALRQYQAAWIERRRAVNVVTELGRQVFDTLDYTLEGKCMTLIDGQARMGKTHAAKAWCDLHPGRARYVQVPSTNDEIGFFRAIAKSLGVSINLNSKAQELRQRIEEVLQRGDLAVIFDEAHYIWPNSNYRDARPTRLTWVITALVNYSVPVCLLTTPQFMRSQKAVERKTCWTSEQFVGRIKHYQKLPEALSDDDLFAVAKSLLPEGCKESLQTLVLYAKGSVKYLAGIDAVVSRARYQARKDGRSKVVFRDIKQAIKESVIPSDNALATALQEEPRRGRRALVSHPRMSPPDAHPQTMAYPISEFAPAPDRNQNCAVIQERARVSQLVET